MYEKYRENYKLLILLFIISTEIMQMIIQIDIEPSEIQLNLVLIN